MLINAMTYFCWRQHWSCFFWALVIFAFSTPLRRFSAIFSRCSIQHVTSCTEIKTAFLSQLTKFLLTDLVSSQAAQSYPVLLVTLLYLYINSILKIIRNPVLLIYYVISLYNSILKITYMCFLKDFNENRPRLALIRGYGHSWGWHDD
jgi:hypothetical protein